MTGKKRRNVHCPVNIEKKTHLLKKLHMYISNVTIYWQMSIFTDAHNKVILMIGSFLLFQLLLKMDSRSRL